MSKFRVIDGDNITSIAAHGREIKQLEFEIQKKSNVTDKDLVVYAYHFVRLGHVLLAQKYLNRLHPDYFDTTVYKDLARALLMWSLVQVDNSLKDVPGIAASYEYSIIIKRALEMFDEVNFQSKPAFYRFRKTFKEFTTVPTAQ